MTRAMELLQGGDVVHAIVQPFTALMGNWFYAIIIMLTFMMIYIKTQSIAIPAMFLLIAGGALIEFFPPEIHAVAYLIIAMGITGLLYKLLKG